MKKKEEGNKGSVNTWVPPGYTIKVSEADEGGWQWAIRRYKKEVASGVTASRVKAERRLSIRLGEILLSAGQRGAATAGHRMKLRYWTERRPYVVMHVLYSLQHNRKRHEVLLDADREEKFLHKRDAKKGVAPPLPTHHLSKPPDTVAGITYDACMALGLVGAKAFRWGAEMLGPSFSHPDADTHLVVERKRAVAAPSKEDDYDD